MKVGKMDVREITAAAAFVNHCINREAEKPFDFKKFGAQLRTLEQASEGLLGYRGDWSERLGSMHGLAVNAGDCYLKVYFNRDVNEMTIDARLESSPDRPSVASIYNPLRDIFYRTNPAYQGAASEAIAQLALISFLGEMLTEGQHATLQENCQDLDRQPVVV